MNLMNKYPNLISNLKVFHAYDDFNPNSNDHLSAFLYGGIIKERFQRPVGHYKTGTRAGEVKYKWEERDKEFQRLINPLPNTELKKEGSSVPMKIPYVSLSPEQMMVKKYCAVS